MTIGNFEGLGGNFKTTISKNLDSSKQINDEAKYEDEDGVLN